MPPASPSVLPDRGLVLRPGRHSTWNAPWRPRLAGGAPQRELAERFGLSTHQVRVALTRNEITGGRLVRELRAQLPELRAPELSDRERGVIELVVIERQTHREAAERLGIAPSTVADSLKRVALRLEREHK
jgi:DNA-binding CsgD family transcriptional regulator